MLSAKIHDDRHVHCTYGLKNCRQEKRVKKARLKMYKGMCNSTKLFFQVRLRKKYLHVDVGIVVVIIIVILKRK